MGRRPEVEGQEIDSSFEGRRDVFGNWMGLRRADAAFILRYSPTRYEEKVKERAAEGIAYFERFLARKEKS